MKSIRFSHKKTLIIIITIFTIVTNIFCEESTELFPIKIDKKWGYISSAGVLAIRAQYDLALPFSEGLASVKVNDKTWAYIDRSGAVVFQVNGQFAGEFKSGLALINTGGRKYGYINKRGEIAIPVRYVSASDFSNGFARVRIKEGEDFYIDSNGQNVFKQYFSDCGTFNEGYAIVRDFNNVKHVINTFGNRVLMPKGFQVTGLNVACGIVVGIYNDSDAFYNLTTKDMVCFDTATVIFGFSNGVSVFSKELKGDDRYGLMDMNGNVIINPVYEDLGQLSDGLLLFAKDGKYGFIDLQENVVIPNTFLSVLPFVNGMAMVNPRDGIDGGYVNRKGQVFLGKDYL
jgi:hypothetical protein